jgi:hypothetical protein
MRPTVAAGVEMVPMAWAEYRMEPPAGGNSPWLMGFNEPDRPGQANMCPQYAAYAWRRLEQLHAGRKLVSPAPSHEDPGWLDAFVAAYQGLYGCRPRLDALACHAYLRSAGEVMALVGTFVKRAQAWGVAGGTWLTEFNFTAGNCKSEKQALAETRACLAALDAEPGVSRYAWFSNRQKIGEGWTGGKTENMAPLIDEAGALTAWGAVYRE